jgi:NAD-dependent dihydropyrimidine dehydrogenase PreA subunit
MIKAYLVGYIHTDLHAGNIYVLNVTTKFNTCIHPFSLNDTGISQVNNPNELFEYFNYKRKNKNYGVSKKCDIIENFCNMSCIEIIDWGRTEYIGVNEDNNAFIIEPTFEKLITIINELKKYYQKFGYLFHLVGLSDYIPDDTTNIDYPQFYVLWLIYNEFKLKAQIESTMKAQNKPTMNCDEIDKKSIVINKDFFNKYSNIFKDNCNTNPFYQSYNV